MTISGKVIVQYEGKLTAFPDKPKLREFTATQFPCKKY